MLLWGTQGHILGWLWCGPVEASSGDWTTHSIWHTSPALLRVRSRPFRLSRRATLFGVCVCVGLEQFLCAEKGQFKKHLCQQGVQSQRDPMLHFLRCLDHTFTLLYDQDTRPCFCAVRRTRAVFCLKQPVLGNKTGLEATRWKQQMPLKCEGFRTLWSPLCAFAVFSVGLHGHVVRVFACVAASQIPPTRDRKRHSCSG